MRRLAAVIAPALAAPVPLGSVTAVVALALAAALPAPLAAQSPAPQPSNGVVLAYERFADRYGGMLVQAFDSIPAARYDYRPTAAQQTVGYIAQHLEDANYSLCQRL